MTKVDSKTCWASMFDADEAEGLTVRVGECRCAPVNASGKPVRWAVMKDGAEYPEGKGFDTRQEAVDWMIDEILSSCTIEQHYASGNL